MTYVILDLEWNSAYSKKQNRYINEIFEFGAVKVDERMQLLDTFSVYIRPTVGKQINPFVKKLTSVSFETLKEAEDDFFSAMKKFSAFLGDSVLMTWSNSDLLALLDNQAYFTGGSHLPFLKKYCNLQSYCEHRLGVGSASRQLGLSTCAELMSISVDNMELHRASDDAYLSYLCLKKIFKKSLLDEFIEDAECEEFYHKLTFKSKNITDLKSPLVDRSQMFFDCPECGVRCIQKTKWNVKSRSFKAYFMCPECKKEFTGQVSVKQKYEGIVFTKKLREKVQNPEDNNAEATSETEVNL